ncbi:MAG TPA: VOC family protein [Trebonia sp.]|jgi:predicted 3-demethylubiquinone-9 3-methyltransferase (glyoxalase superfamily)|nr:VOC family protein [Trebonia sp.]
MAVKITTFLMFEGRAEEAMSFYTGLFSASQVLSVERYGPGEAGAAGTIKHALFTVAGLELMCIDSPAPHEFSFTPAVSLFAECEDEAEQDRVYAALTEGGAPLMPLGDYGIGRKFGWVSDRFGVSWQLLLP